MKHTLKSVLPQISSLVLIANACTSGQSVPVATSNPATATTTAVATAVPQSDKPIGEASLAIKQVAGSEALWLMPVDPETGDQVAGYDPIELGGGYNQRLTPDGRTLVVVTTPVVDNGNASLRFLDLTTWSEPKALLLPTPGWTSAMSISPDGALVAFATSGQRQNRIWLVDLRRHVLLSRVEVPRPVVEMAFTSDSQAVMLYERQENYQTGLSEGAPVAELRSGRNLAIFWSSTLSDVRDGFQAFEGQTGQPHEPGTGSTYRPAVVFDAQAKAMYVIHADTARLTRVDFRRYATLTQDITPELSVIERLLALGSITAHAKVQDGIERHAVISPDGSAVYTAGLQTKLTKNSSDGMWDLVQSYLPLQAIRLADAAELYRSEATGDTMDISTDGQTILLARWDLAEGDGAGTTVVDAATGAVQDDVEGYQLRHSSRLGGSPLVVGSSYAGGGRSVSTLAAYDLGLKLIGSWQTRGYGDWILLR